jgi:hypothetical protein
MDFTSFPSNKVFAPKISLCKSAFFTPETVSAETAEVRMCAAQWQTFRQQAPAQFVKAWRARN